MSRHVVNHSPYKYWWRHCWICVARKISLSKSTKERLVPGWRWTSFLALWNARCEWTAWRLFRSHNDWQLRLAWHTTVREYSHIFWEIVVFVLGYYLSNKFNKFTLNKYEWHTHASTLVLLPSAVPLSSHSICFLHCLLQIPYLFSLLPTEQILVLHWALSASIFSALVCAFSFSSLVQN